MVFTDDWSDPLFVWGGSMVAEDSDYHCARSDDSGLTYCGLKITGNIRGPKNATCSECRRLHYQMQDSEPEK